MLQLIGIPFVLAAWALPALFVLTLAFLFGLAVFRPLYMAWARAWDATAAALQSRVASLTERMAARAYGYAVSHSRPER